MLLLPTPVRHTAHRFLHELCKRHSYVPQIATFDFPAFTLNSFYTASFYIESLLTHSSSESAMVTRSSAYRPSERPPKRISRDMATYVLLRWPKFAAIEVDAFVAYSWTTQWVNLGRYGLGFTHWRTFPGLMAQSICQHLALSWPTRYLFLGYGQIISLCPRMPYEAACSLLHVCFFHAAVRPQRLHL